MTAFMNALSRGQARRVLRSILNDFPEWLLALLLLIQTHHRAVDLALVVVVSVIVASGLLTALILSSTPTRARSR